MTYWKNTAPGLYEGRAVTMTDGEPLQVFVRKIQKKVWIQVYDTETGEVETLEKWHDGIAQAQLECANEFNMVE
ncbi:unnamed protein product, partial [marine sediment metagenome]